MSASDRPLRARSPPPSGMGGSVTPSTPPPASPVPPASSTWAGADAGTPLRGGELSALWRRPVGPGGATRGTDPPLGMLCALLIPGLMYPSTRGEAPYGTDDLPPPPA